MKFLILALIPAALLGGAEITRGAVKDPVESKEVDPAAKEAYLEQLARQSIEEKVAVGKARYEQRRGYRRAIISTMRRTAEARRNVISRPDRPRSDSPALRAQSASALNFWAFLAMLVGLIYLARRHFVARSR